MNPAAKRFQKTYGPIADAVSSVDIGQTNREAVALALANALDGRPDFRRDAFLVIASDRAPRQATADDESSVCSLTTVLA